MKVQSLLYIFITISILLTGCNNRNSSHPIDLTGSWSGIVYNPENGSEDIHILYQIEQTDSGTYKGFLHNLDESDMYNRISIQCEDRISLKTLHSLPSEFCGIYVNDSTLQGIYSILDYPWEMTLKKVSLSTRLNRPQRPYTNDAYEIEYIRIPNPETPDVILDAEFFIPKEGKNHPAVLLVAGSGPLDKYETIAGHRIFWVLADYLATRGIAVLIYDKRGTNSSTGNYMEATTEDYASDAWAAFQYLEKREEINKAKTGIAGHSEGSFIACMLAARYPAIPFIISMAGVGVPMQEKVKQTGAYMKEKKGINEEDSQEQEMFSQKLKEIIGDTPHHIIFENMEDYIDKLLEENEKKSPYLRYKTATLLAPLASPWFKYILEYDPTETLKKVKCPVFAFNGDKDCHVVAAPNLAAIDSLIKSNGNQQVTIKCYPDINHMFQHCETGLMHEYGLIEETFAPEILADITGWIHKLP